MLVETTFKQGRFYTGLYHIIPENHILKRIDSAISLSFVNELLADRYCKNYEKKTCINIVRSIKESQLKAACS